MIYKDFIEIGEVVIPPRGDKRGKRFGFARLYNAKDEKMMETKLDNIIIGSRKIYENIPRFSRKRFNKRKNSVITKPRWNGW